LNNIHYILGLMKNSTLGVHAQSVIKAANRRYEKFRKVSIDDEDKNNLRDTKFFELMVSMLSNPFKL